MSYCLPANSKVRFIALRISNINQMVDFYTKVIGLSLIRRTEKEAYLGIPSQKRIFISLREIDNPSKNRQVPNLKSFSLVLPNCKNLKQNLVHINNLGIKIPRIEINPDFNRFYLTDPEGNRIYVVAPTKSCTSDVIKRMKWLDLKFKPVTLSTYLKDFNVKRNLLPETTRFGWIKLQVNDLKRSLDFYQNQLGLLSQVDSRQHQAVLISKGDHHQQFILKQADNLNQRNFKTLGLSYFDVHLIGPNDISQLAQHLKMSKIDCQYSPANHFIFVQDPDRIGITFSML